MASAFSQDEVLIQEFVAESLEHLADVEAELLSIENANSEDYLQTVNRVFRSVHSIKGAAGFLELAHINELAHALEEVLGRFRDRQLNPRRLLRHACRLIRHGCPSAVRLAAHKAVFPDPVSCEGTSVNLA